MSFRTRDRVTAYDPGLFRYSASFPASAESGARRISALAMDSFVHGAAGGGLCRARLGAAGIASLSFGYAGGGCAGVIGTAGRLRVRAAKRSWRTQSFAAGFAAARGRGSVGGSTRPTQRVDCALAAQFQRTH